MRRCVFGNFAESWDNISRNKINVLKEVAINRAIGDLIGQFESCNHASIEQRD